MKNISIHHWNDVTTIVLETEGEKQLACSTLGGNHVTVHNFVAILISVGRGEVRMGPFFSSSSLSLLNAKLSLLHFFHDLCFTFWLNVLPTKKCNFSKKRKTYGDKKQKLPTVVVVEVFRGKLFSRELATGNPQT